MKSLFLITSLLVCDLAGAQIGVGLTIGVALPAGSASSASAAGPISSILAAGPIPSVLALAACTQDPVRGLVNVVNGLPLVSGLLACSSYNQKFVTATSECRALRYAGSFALREEQRRLRDTPPLQTSRRRHIRSQRFVLMTSAHMLSYATDIQQAPTPTVTATETTINFELETSTPRTITATTYTTSVLFGLRCCQDIC